MAGLWLDTRRRIVMAVAVALALAAVTAPSQASAASACPGADSTPYEAGVLQARAATLCLINALRARHELPRLEHDGELALAAARHAADMARRDFFSHRTPGGETFVDRILATDYVTSPGQRWTFGENIGWGKRNETTPRNLVRGWMRSPTHRVNILDGRFRDAGVAVVLAAPRPGQPKPATYDVTFGVIWLPFAR